MSSSVSLVCLEKEVFNYLINRLFIFPFNFAFSFHLSMYESKNSLSKLRPGEFLIEKRSLKLLRPISGQIIIRLKNNLNT